MSHDYIKYLVQQHTSIKLLKMDNAPLIISFLFKSFKENNVQSIPEGRLTDLLENFLFALRQSTDEKQYPLSAKNYLDKWVTAGFLRKSYIHTSDEPIFQLTSNIEIAFSWIQSLDKKEFIGTESRLLQVFRLLEDLTEKSTANQEERISILEKQKQKTQDEIDQIKQGKKPVTFDDTQIKERFYEVENLTYNLLGDFRQIEENFRELDKETREKQLKSNLTRGKIVGDVLDAQESLWSTDQGKSFTAFWEFLMSQSKQDQLDTLIQKVLVLPQIQQLDKSSQLNHFKILLIEAGNQVNKTNHLLVEHLRQFLDSHTQLERRQIVETIEAIEKMALKVKTQVPLYKTFFELPYKPALDFTLSRPLFTPVQKVVIKENEIEEGKTDLNPTILFEQVYIDPRELKNNIHQLLKKQVQVTLKEVTDHYPISKGLQEVLTYYSIASKDTKAMIQETVLEEISIRNDRNEDNDDHSTIEAPQIIFT